MTPSNAIPVLQRRESGGVHVATIPYTVSCPERLFFTIQEESSPTKPFPSTALDWGAGPNTSTRCPVLYEPVVLSTEPRLDHKSTIRIQTIPGAITATKIPLGIATSFSESSEYSSLFRTSILIYIELTSSYLLLLYLELIDIYIYSKIWL